MKRQANTAALYCRLSRDDGGDAESNSIQTQRMMLQRYAKEHGLAASEYIDDGYSGTSFDRPNFQRMIADIEAGKISTVICKDLSRLGRNNAMVAYYTEMHFLENDVRFIALNDGIDTAHGENEIMPFKSVINEYYARDISKKVRTAKRTRALAGEHYGGRAPYGYIKDPADRHRLVIDEETADTVRWMFQLAADGMGVYRIARQLYEKKILIPSALEFQRSGSLQSKFDPDCPWDWSDKTVAGILRNPMYLGHMVNHRLASKSFKMQKLVRVPQEDWIIVENTHAPLVSQQLFDRVQPLVAVKQRENQIGHENIFAGLLVCAECGKGMRFLSCPTMRGGEGAFNCATYRSGNRNGAENPCSSHHIGYTALREAVLSNINLVLQASFDRDAFVELLKNGTEDGLANEARELARCKRRESELRSLVRRAFEQNASGLLSDGMFADLCGGYQTELQQLTEQIAQLDAKLTAGAKGEDNAARFLQLAQQYGTVQELTREILLDFVEKIFIHEATGAPHSKNRRRVIEIHYRFIGRLPGEAVSL
ncbi:MAG: recombinase family protein [Oscillospiraceae bacterium]|nr:recombinase family protein [Oscillospiraceae bacterium]